MDRPATEADFQTAGQVIEVAETAEEVVVGKKARVVEEVVVGKETTQHTENISDTVRHTEVEVERIGDDETLTGADKPARARLTQSSEEIV